MLEVFVLIVVLVIGLIWGRRLSRRPALLESPEPQLPESFMAPAPDNVRCPSCKEDAPKTHFYYSLVVYTCPSCNNGFVYKALSGPRYPYTLLDIEKPLINPDGTVFKDGGAVRYQYEAHHGYWYWNEDVPADPDENWSQGVWEYARCRVDCKPVPGHARLVA